MEPELWKQLSFTSRYEVSTYGNIRNTKTHKLLSLCDKGDGYLYVTIYNGTKYVNRSIHTLVAQSFLVNNENKTTVNHIDKNQKNNRVTNLEWATHSEQINHRIALSGVPMIKGRKIIKHDISTGEKLGEYTSIKAALDSVNEEKNGYTWKILNHMEDAYGFKWTFDDNMSGEIWKSIPESICYNFGYSVSNLGRIKNNIGKILEGHITKRGYISVKIQNKAFFVHRIVATVFLGNIGEDYVVNHKDGNKSNNILENLEIVTQSQNIQHAYDTKLIEKTNKVKVIQVDEYGNIVRIFDSMTEVEKITGINRGNIHKGINSKSTIKGYRWFDDVSKYNEEVRTGTIKNTLKVFQCTLNGSIINTFNKYPEASKETGISVSAISRSCNTHMNAGGFKWFKCYKDYESFKEKLT